MADDIDRAQAEEERFLAAAITNITLGQKTLKPTGHCLYCAETVAAGVRFCSTECRDDFDRLTAARARNGCS
jgi:hypothetical protein